jgi:ferredoxin
MASQRDVTGIDNMAAKKVTVVISQGQGKNPVQRNLEEEIAAALIMQPDVDVSIVPHLYDMSGDHTGLLFLRSVPGNVVVLSWLYPRAARWTLARQGVHGHEGVTLLKSDDEDEDEELDAAADETQESRGVGVKDMPNRKLYFIDLRSRPRAEPFLSEIRRIANEQSVQTVDLMQWISGKPKAEQLERYLHPERMLSPAAANANGVDAPAAPANADVPEPTKRRWYPVIDYSRCTNCMECIDFCLFGVYGVDNQDVILVEQQDKSSGAWTSGFIGPVYTTAINLTILQLEKGILPIYQR